MKGNERDVWTVCEHENERWGRYTEWVARIRYGLTADREVFHDARADDGTPVEVKGCIRRTAAGRRGKFFVRQANHERLVDAGGKYALAVYDPSDWKRGPILAMAVRPATWLDDVDAAWTGNGSRRGEVVKRPRWNAVFSPEDIPGGPGTATTRGE